MQNERIRTEEHIEYDSDDSPEDGSSSSSSKSSHFELEPEVYKTRKDENFVEYFKVGKENNNNRVSEDHNSTNLNQDDTDRDSLHRNVLQKHFTGFRVTKGEKCSS